MTLSLAPTAFATVPVINEINFFPPSTPLGIGWY